MIRLMGLAWSKHTPDQGADDGSGWEGTACCKTSVLHGELTLGCHLAMDRSIQVFKLIRSVLALLCLLLAGAARACVLDAACEHVHMIRACMHAPCRCICSNPVARPDAVSDLKMPCAPASSL